MTALLQYLHCWPRDTNHFPIGIIQELRFDPSAGRTTQREGEFTTLQFIQEFPRASIAYVGLSSFNDNEIYNTGKTLSFNLLFVNQITNLGLARSVWMKRSWDYRVLKGNCQHFASYLLEILTGHEPLPHTISKLMKDFIHLSNQLPLTLQSSTASPSPASSRRSVGLGNLSTKLNGPNFDRILR